MRLGIDLERAGQWYEAIEHYEKALKQQPDNKDLQYGLRRSKIHFSIERRYSDASFETSMLRMPRNKALSLFDEVLQQIRMNYVDRLNSTSIVAHGSESLYVALANKKFVQHNLQNVSKARIEQMRGVLYKQFWNKPIANRQEARRTVSDVCDYCRSILGLPSGPVVMEYVFGGCNALDDYSSYLTPNRWKDLKGNIDGEFVGLGIEMKAEPGKGMLLVNVLPDSPAEEGGMLPGEYIVGIGETDCRYLTTDEGAKLLRGLAGSRVRLRLQDALGDVRERYFVRREVQVKSIPVARIIDRLHGVAYIRMTGFQRSTVRELDEALARLQRQGMQSLIWDLRGNPGGLLTASAEVLDRFISDGVLVSTQGRSNDQNWTYSAHRQGTFTVPLVLLVDGDSASASEIVAGAIRDHHRGLIVGRKTFGKWSVQTIINVSHSTALRLTTAKFYSPRGRNLSKIGLSPDIVVEKANRNRTYFRAPKTVDVERDPDLKKALEILQSQLSRRERT
ncbi:MAG: tetratricopeptide repeat protein [Planctomycetes bacterium]|nr:tetratricopeptide repeat protein [Planctomycetota bacterium]